jgi:hypothetical protein
VRPWRAPTMPPKVTIEELRPYRAALIARFEEGEELSAAQLLVKLKTVLKVKSGTGARRIVASESRSEVPQAAFVHYEQRRQVSWSKVRVLDRVNYLAVILQQGRWVAIHTTETSRRETIGKALRAGELGALRTVDPPHLKAAFIKGRARTLWLRGTHRSNPSKPDTKVIAGPDLGSALDPQADQTYRYTAARCEPDNDAIGPVMGLAVDQSRLWIGPSSDWAEFETSILATLEALEESSAAVGAEPLPVLVNAAADLSEVQGAYDLGVAPPEILLIGPVLNPVEAGELAGLERLAFDTTFEVTSTDGAGLRARVSRGARELGELELEFSDGSGEIETSVAGAAAPGAAQEFAEVLDAARDPEILTVYFESGHTIQDRQAFSIRHRDLPFEGWAWADFGPDWEVDREKPEAGVSAIGEGDRSLFSWVLGQWPGGAGIEGARGWLACDDRPGETADFLHLDDSGEVPVLSLIHCKAAHGASAARELAVVPYETVAAQAAKNIRHLDAVLAAQTMLSSTLPAGLEMAAWQEGERRSRSQFIERLDGLGANFRRRVVIVQPHVRRDLLEVVRDAGAPHHQLPRLRQLDTLLLSAAANCQSSGARLIVVGAQ